MPSLLLEILAIALLAVAVARLLPEPWRGRGLNLLKAYVTVRVFWILLAHQVTLADGSRESAWTLIRHTVAGIDPRVFWIFVLASAAIKFVGILASMQRWRLLLRGQGIDLPFRHIFGAFLIGRFIGTFLPSTAGLDGYTLYDASRFSGRTVESTAAKALEKAMGISGIFLAFLVALPFGTSIFGDKARLVVMLTVPVATAIIGVLLLLLWYPALVQWGIEHLPLPGKGRIQGLVQRISQAAAAYRGQQRLVLAALFLSFVVHFTTAAMYYFTALAISAKGAAFWPIVLGSAIQIFATVMSPFTIAGEGIREAAQYALLGHMIGAGAAIVSAALGFWAAEALTLVGGIVWWVRARDYRPAYCLVDGQQVDYEEAARAALVLETDEERARRESAPTTPPLPLASRLRVGAAFGIGAGILAGLLLGVPETYVIAREGLGTEAQVLWYGPLAYSLIFAALGLAGGLVLALLPLDRKDLRGWTPSLVLLGSVIPVGLFITVFRLRRDVYLEHMPPIHVLLPVLGAFAAFAALLFFAGPAFFRSRAGALARPFVAGGLLVAVLLGGSVMSGRIAEPAPKPAPTPPVPTALASRPNLILVMVDTLRQDHVSCYTKKWTKTPNICRLAKDGTLYNGFSHASWTKPSTATFLTSLVPTSHQTMSKTAALPEGVTTVAEALKAGGYVTGGFVTNTNLAPSFGFDQGFDEYHYLAPDYLSWAKESSSKLILYQIWRRIFFKIHPGLRVTDFYQPAPVMNAHALNWVKRERHSRFFLFLHYMDVHDPYFAHPYDGYGIDRAADQHPPASMAKEMHRLYIGEVEYLDRNFGKFLDGLQKMGLYNNSVIILIADHGEEFQEHGGYWHGTTLYDEEIHVPFIVKWAQGDRLAPPDERGHQERLIDVAPTLVARAGLPEPASWQGSDVTALKDPADPKNRLLFAEEDLEGNDLKAIRDGKWKYIKANEGNPRGLPTRELFHVAADPAERHNLVDTDTQLAAKLAGEVKQQLLIAKQDRPGKARKATISEAERKALIALGYIQPDEEKPKK